MEFIFLLYFFFLRKKFERFKVLNAVVLRNILDKTWKDKRINENINWPFFKTMYFGALLLEKKSKQMLV